MRNSGKSLYSALGILLNICICKRASKDSDGELCRAYLLTLTRNMSGSRVFHGFLQIPAESACKTANVLISSRELGHFGINILPRSLYSRWFHALARLECLKEYFEDIICKLMAGICNSYPDRKNAKRLLILTDNPLRA